MVKTSLRITRKLDWRRDLFRAGRLLLGGVCIFGARSLRLDRVCVSGARRLLLDRGYVFSTRSLRLRWILVFGARSRFCGLAGVWILLRIYRSVLWLR